MTDSELEVEELTQLLRTDAYFADLRAMLISRGVSPDDVLLAGLIGGEDNQSYGVFVDRACRCTVFEITGNGRIIRWETDARPESLGADFAAVDAAVAMVAGRAE